MSIEEIIKSTQSQILQYETLTYSEKYKKYNEIKDNIENCFNLLTENSFRKELSNHKYNNILDNINNINNVSNILEILNQLKNMKINSISDDIDISILYLQLLKKTQITKTTLEYL